MSAKDNVSDVIAQHPRLIGFLFAAMVLLSQAGSVAAGNGFQTGP